MLTRPATIHAGEYLYETIINIYLAYNLRLVWLVFRQAVVIVNLNLQILVLFITSSVYFLHCVPIYTFIC